MHDRRARRWRSARRTGLFCLLVVGLGAAVFPVASGWSTPPTFSRSSAAQALEGARSAGAARWAAPALRLAEERHWAAEGEFRRQEVRLLPLRDFRTARNRFRDAEQAATRARDAAVRSRGDLQISAAAAVDNATCAVARTEELYRLFRLKSEAIELMRASKLKMHEAELLIAQGEFGLARLKAEDAVGKAGLVRQQMIAVLDRFVDHAAVRRWRDEQAAAVAWSKRTGEPAIVVNKDKGVLTLYRAGGWVRTFEVEIGQNQLERKRAAGDGATPEGSYRVTAKRQAGQTRYYKALDLDYPNENDRRQLAQAVERGVLPAGSRPGGWIEIHGEGGRGWDWTDGCIALRNRDMDELFDRVPSGTRVTIIGADGEEGRFSALVKSLKGWEIEVDCRLD